MDSVPVFQHCGVTRLTNRRIFKAGVYRLLRINQFAQQLIKDDISSIEYHWKYHSAFNITAQVRALSVHPQVPGKWFHHMLVTAM